MGELYSNLFDTELTYVATQVRQNQDAAMALASYSASGFTTFKNGIASTNNAKADSAFVATNIKSSYSKAVHANNISYTHYNVNYYSMEMQDELDLENELNKLNSYLLSTNQEMPKSLSDMIEAQAKKSVNLNKHQNIVVEESSPYEVILEEDNGATTLAQGYYSKSYGGNGDTNTWYRHGNWSNYVAPAYSQSSYSDYHSDYYGDYSNYSNYSDYSDYYDYYNHSNHTNHNQTIQHGYTQTTYPVKYKTQFTPIQPQIFAPEMLTDMQSKITLGFTSYDRNVAKSGEANFASIRYKVELRKTTGPNTRTWVTLQDGTADTISINPMDPFSIGWTKTSQGYGDYELRITPYNPASTVSASDGWSYTSAQLTGTATTVKFHVAINHKPTVDASYNATAIGSTLYMDGVVKGGVSYNYPGFYGSSITTNHGLYLLIGVNEPDAGQFLKGFVTVKNRATGTKVIEPVKIIWSNGSDVIESTGGTMLGYLYIPSSQLYNTKFDGQLEIEVYDHYENPNVTTTTGKLTTIRQNFVSAGNSSLLNLSFDMQKTLNYDKVQVVPNSKLTEKPTINIAVNQQAHLADSFSKMMYSWSNSDTTAGTWLTTTNRELTTQPPSEGKWYLHQAIYDKYGAVIKNVTGPLYYSNIQYSLSSPTVTHFDDTDRVKIKANVGEKPNLPVNYTFRYGYRVKGSGTDYIYSDWQTSASFTTGNIGLSKDIEIITQSKVDVTNEVVTSNAVTITLAEKLAWNIKNQNASNYNIQSISAPIYEKHDSTGLRTDGYQLVKTNAELNSTLRPNEYFYYKLGSDGKYLFKKIIYFSDPLN